MKKENLNLASINALIVQIEKLNKRMKKDPLLFYDEPGKQLILLTKELHVQGGMLLRAHQLTKESIKTLKKIPLRK